MQTARWIAIIFSVVLLIAVLSGLPAIEDGAAFVAGGVAFISLVVLAHPAGRGAVALHPQGMLDLMLSLALIAALVDQGHSIAASLFLVAVAVEVQARQFKFDLI